jgi:hypothetical protein
MRNRAKSLFVQFYSTNFTIEQNWWHFCSAILYLKDNYEVRISKFGVLESKFRPAMRKWKFCSANFIVELIWRRHCWVIWGPKTKLQTQNFEMCKFKGLLQIPNLECYFEFEFVSVQYCNMMKVFTRPTSASDFFMFFGTKPISYSPIFHMRQLQKDHSNQN